MGLAETAQAFKKCSESKNVVVKDQQDNPEVEKGLKKNVEADIETTKRSCGTSKQKLKQKAKLESSTKKKIQLGGEGRCWRRRAINQITKPVSSNVKK